MGAGTNGSQKSADTLSRDVGFFQGREEESMTKVNLANIRWN
jgi:hypothetical protein